MYLDDVILGDVVLVATNLNLEHDKAGGCDSTEFGVLIKGYLK